MFQTKKVAALAITVAALTVPLAACGDDEESAGTQTPTTAAETVQEFASRLETDCPGQDPGFDPFLAENSDPTLEEWAAFYDTPIGALDTMMTCLSDLNPPAEVADELQAVIDAMGVVKADIVTAKEFAEAGDEDGMNGVMTEMREVHQPEIDVAIQAFMDAVAAG